MQKTIPEGTDQNHRISICFLVISMHPLDFLSSEHNSMDKNMFVTGCAGMFVFPEKWFRSTAGFPATIFSLHLAKNQHVRLAVICAI
jgi:hypothetical protein